MSTKPTSEEIKNTIYWRLLSHYKALCLNRYRWENLPNNIQSRHIEQALFYKGQAFFTDHKDYGMMCLGCYESGSRNIYNDPISVILTGFGFSEQIKIDNGVRILANESFYPDYFLVSQYVQKLTESENVIRKNLSQQKFPYMILTSKNKLFTMKKIYEQAFEDEKDAIFTDESLTAGDKALIQVLETKAPYVVDKILEYKQSVENELLTTLGINSNPNKKSERMIVDEVNVNNSEVELNLDLGYKTRQEAADAINDKYNLDVKVEKVLQIIEPTFNTTLDNYNNNNNNGGGENG